MCQAVVFLGEQGKEKEIMRDVVLLEPSDEGVRLQVFFEPPVILHATIARIDFLKHTVTLRPAEGGRDDGN